MRGKEGKSKNKLSDGPDWEDRTRMEVEDEAPRRWEARMIDLHLHRT